MRVHLVDGTYELFRAHFGAPSMRAPDGREVGAVRGLLRSLTAWLRSGDVTHIACAFDHVIESFRNERFAGYKTSEGVDPALLAQFSLAEACTRALGLVTWPMVRFEADDALATGAARLADDPAVTQVLLCSPDKDLAQCVRGDRVVCLDRARGTLLNEAAVAAKFGVSPASIADYLALVGDPQDGIPGVARWGAKSAATVLARYAHIEHIPDDAARWECSVRGAPALAATLAAQRDDAKLYRELATLRTDVPLDERLDDLAWRGADRAALTTLCETLGERAVIERIPRWRDSHG
jgi:5'-3' exonuclease